jgi:hypothetical protein
MSIRDNVYVKHGPTVTVSRQELPFNIIKPVRSQPRTNNIQIVQDPTPSDVDLLFQDMIDSGSVVAFDFETRGTRAYTSEDYIVGVGFSWSQGSVYFNLPRIQVRQYILHKLTDFPAGKLIAHNLYFDASWIYRETGKHPPYLACTYGMLYQLANEGFEGQRWGLKWAQENILGWQNTNEERLDRWLIEYGYVKNVSKEQKQGYYWYPEWVTKSEQISYGEFTVEGDEIIHTIQVPTDNSGRWVKPNKSEMWRAPSDILGYYCCLDADATYQLYTEVLAPALQRFPRLTDYHAKEFMTLVTSLVEQHIFGFRSDIDAAIKAIIDHPDVKPHIIEWESMKLKEHYAKEPDRYTKKKEKPAEPAKYKVVKLGKEPNKYKKDGTLSKNWERWDEKRKRAESPPISQTWLRWKSNVDAGKYEPKISLNWKNWHDKLRDILNAKVPAYLFNLNSGPQLRWLLYEKMGFPVLLHTDSGLPATGGKALGAMGAVGKLLQKHDHLHKELSYVDAYLEMITEEGRLHPSFRVPGTLTGRLAGKTPNIQQVPKSVGTMSCFIPDDGHVWVDCDHKALEQVVLAELSGDPSLMKLYGPEAKPNDVYLFVGSQLPVIGDAIRLAGYDPDNPTRAGIAAAKAHCKKERAIAKVAVLASSYGAGAKKLHQTLTLSGIAIELSEVYEIHQNYWKLFAGVKRYEARLQEEWRVNGGWVLNGIGRPVCVDEKYLKDIVNRVCQSTGHDIHMMYWYELRKLIQDHSNPVVLDWHDQSIVQCQKENAELIAATMENTTYRLLNEKLGGIIPMSGEAMIIDNMAECKLDAEQLGYKPGR